MPILALLLAAVAALLSYRFLEDWTGRSWLPAGCRALAWGCVALLLVNASCPTVGRSARPSVLLDGSLSMQAAGGRWSEALAMARAAGEVRLVGPPAGDTTPSAGRSRLADALTAARSSGRQVIVVTDGEIEDADEIPASVLEGATIRVLSRRKVPDVALVRVDGSARVTPSDSLRVEVEAESTGERAGRRPLEVEVREAGWVWLRGSVSLDAGGHGRAVLRGPVPATAPGPHVLTVALSSVADSEPRDDRRLLVVTVLPTPGVVLLASPPTWESRFLLETLRDVAAVPVRGYLETEQGRWRRAGDLHPVSTLEVADAARRADLLVTMGAVGAVAGNSRARGRWTWLSTLGRPASAGDWYVSVGPATPVSGAMTGLAVDSFPPGTALAEISTGTRDWVGLTAQGERRGAVRPVLVGRDSAGERRISVGMDGLWRWAFQGGSSEQGYRALVASSVSWLLGGADSAAGQARPQRQVVQRGRPAIFEWIGSTGPAPLPIQVTGESDTRRDTLVFDGAGRAELLLPPGVWHYRLGEGVGGGGAGVLAVEEFSDEWVPGRPSLAVREGTLPAEGGRVPLRTLVWLFGIAVLAFAGEWYARRRMGLR